jgi:hypothetical protein
MSLRASHDKPWVKANAFSSAVRWLLKSEGACGRAAGSDWIQPEGWSQDQNVALPHGDPAVDR